MRRAPRSFLLAGALALGACAPAADAPPDPDDLALLGTKPATPLDKVAFTLPDPRGEPFDFRSETAGRIALLFFGYTYCPDVCPVHMATLAAALAEVDPDVRALTRVVFVTVDPARDTPERLERWVAAFDPSFVGVRGTEAEVARALAFYRYPPPERSGAGPGYTVGHPALVYAFTPDGRGRALYGAETTRAVWVHDLTLMARHAGSGAAEPRTATTPGGGPELAVAGAVHIVDAVVPAPPTATTTALYATFRNAGPAADTLLGLATGAAGAAALHQMVAEGGVMRMAPLEGGLPLPPGETVRLEPGARHGMLEGLRGRLEPGGTVAVTFRFARAGAVEVAVPVVRYQDVGRRAPPGD